MTIAGEAAPRDGFVLRMPKSLVAKASADGKPLECAENGDIAIPNGTTQIAIGFN